MLRTAVDGEQFLHKIIWIATKRQLEHATDQPKGAFYDCLTAMVFATLALEAYLNFAGERLAPTFWRHERTHFRATGFAGKLVKVLELCGIPEPVKTAGTYYTILKLKKLRDLIAHGKSIRFSETVDHSQNNIPQRYKIHLDRMVSLESARAAVVDVEAFAALIHEAARPLVQDPWFGETAFGGILRIAGGHTALAERP